MKQDIMSAIISKLRLSGMDEVEAQLMLIDLLIELKNQEVITINHDSKFFSNEIY